MKVVRNEGDVHCFYKAMSHTLHTLGAKQHQFCADMLRAKTAEAFGSYHDVEEVAHNVSWSKYASEKYGMSHIEYERYIRDGDKFATNLEIYIAAVVHKLDVRIFVAKEVPNFHGRKVFEYEQCGRYGRADAIGTIRFVKTSTRNCRFNSLIPRNIVSVSVC